MKILVITLVVIGLISIGLSFNSAAAELTANNAFVLEGSGFAVTENTIKNSQIDFILSTGNIANGRGSINFEDGFVTLGDDDFLSENILGTILRDGRYLRISGTAEDSSGNEITLRFFGRLIEDSNAGSIYSFSGRLIQGNTEYKIIYTSKLSGFESGIMSTPSSTSSTEPEENTIHILEGASSQNLDTNYINALGGAPRVAGYLSVDRLSIEPGTTVTFVNDDTVSHTIVSGTGLGQHSRASQGTITICDAPVEKLPEGFSFVPEGAESKKCEFSLDGRINSGVLSPGQSVSVTFEDAGFYRIIDPDYPWVSLTVYSFPNVGSLVIGTPGEAFN